MTFTARLCVLISVLALLVGSNANLVDAQERNNYKGFYYGYCTYYAAQEFDKFAATAGGIDWRGNGGAWLHAAAAKGWKTSTDPLDAQVGAVIVWASGGPGHVAVVTDVDENGITIREMNWRVNSEGVADGGFNRVNSSYLPFSTGLNRRRYTFLGFVFPERDEPALLATKTDEQQADSENPTVPTRPAPTVRVAPRHTTVRTVNVAKKKPGGYRLTTGKLTHKKKR